jgi:ABC-type phosphate transport system substrate-binding protein
MRTAVAALVMSVVVTLGSAGTRAATEPGFVVIVAADNPVGSVKKQELARYFLKKSGRWADGRGIVPVDQSAGSPVRNAFTKAVLSVEGMGQISAVQSFWLQQVYSGRSTPPAVKATDADVLAFVAATPGAIGYVAAAPSAGGVKVLTVTE